MQKGQHGKLAPHSGPSFLACCEYILTELRVLTLTVFGFSIGNVNQILLTQVRVIIYNINGFSNWTPNFLISTGNNCDLHK